MPKLDVLSFIEHERSECDLSGERRLLIIQVGDDDASNMYIRSKMKEAEKWNVNCVLLKVSDGYSDWHIKAQANALLNYCNENKAFDGVIIQSPVGSEHDFDELMDKIVTPELDVDGFYYGGKNLASGYVESYYQPCTPKGIMMYLKHLIDLDGKNVVVIGRGKTVGEPLIKMLLKEKCTLTCCNSHTTERQLTDALCDADVVISAVGEPELFMAKDLQPGCIVIDAGISRVNGKQVGDFSHEGDLDKVYYTPWTNGVGKLTVAALMMNVRGLL